MAPPALVAPRPHLAAPIPELRAAGDVLRGARRSAGMSQHFLGVLLGATQQTVSRWEQGLGAPEGVTQDALRRILPLPEGLWGRRRP